MSRKPTTLWKPEASEKPDERGWIMCANTLCTNVVGKEGGLCSHHQPRDKFDRMPSNLKIF